MIYSLSILFPPSTSGALCLRLSASTPFLILSTFLISCLSARPSNQDNGFYDAIQHPNCNHSSRLMPPVEYLVRRNRFPTQWYYRAGPGSCYPFRRGEPDATPAVGSPGAPRFTPCSQCSLTNSTRYRMDRQMAHNRSLRGRPSAMALCPQRRRLVRGHRHHLLSTSTGSSLIYGGQGPSGSEICSSTYQCRGKDDIWDAPDVMIVLSVNYGSVRDPAGNLRLYDLLKEQNQMASHLMTGSNIRDDPRRGRSAIIHRPTPNSPTVNHEVTK